MRVGYASCRLVIKAQQLTDPDGRMFGWKMACLALFEKTR